MLIFFHFCTKRHYVCEDVVITGLAASEARPPEARWPHITVIIVSKQNA